MSGLMILIIASGTAAPAVSTCTPTGTSISASRMITSRMSEEEERAYIAETLQTLREIRDGQREIIQLLSAQRALVEEQSRRSRETIAESVGLQRQALARQRAITLIAVPGILACIAAIAYLVFRYF